MPAIKQAPTKGLYNRIANKDKPKVRAKYLFIGEVDVVIQSVNFCRDDAVSLVQLKCSVEKMSWHQIQSKKV